jgi:formamidopyrimidine-DNA glycosylase
MPELPEVQTVVNDLCSEKLIHKSIVSACIEWSRSCAFPSVPEFKKRIKSKTIKRIWRRGKFIVFDLSDSFFLFIHLRMTGRLHVYTAGEPMSKHEHVRFFLSDGRELRLHDTRKFARVYLSSTIEKVVGTLGVEPLSQDFTFNLLRSLCYSRKRSIKPFLLDQTIIAGLGNIYADEALWCARIHPLRLSSTLTEGEIRALHTSIQAVLKKGLKNRGTTLGTGKGNFYSVARRKGKNKDSLNVFRRTGEPCPACGRAISRIIVGQRSTHMCEVCQK